MKHHKLLAIATFLTIALGACSSESIPSEDSTSEDSTSEDPTTTEDSSALTVEEESLTAKAVLSGTTEANEVTGEAIYTQEDDGRVTANISIADAIEGTHGIHIHANPSCEEAEDTPGQAAGGHWALEETDLHGESNTDPSHIGDMGNITVDAEGNGTLEVSNDLWTLGDGSATDVAGHAIIFHADEDTFAQPTGEAGGRSGCGIIELLEA